MLRTKEIRIQIAFHLILTAIGCIGCLFLSVRAAAVLLAISLLQLLITLFLHRKRTRDITNLCDCVDEILHGADQVTFTKFQEGELSILASEIHKMTVRLREQNSRLSDEQQFMKEAMEDISHQLRTPLTSTMLIVEMMRSPKLSSNERMEYLQELYGLLSRMQWLIETLLTLSRLDAGAVRFQKSSVRCQELVDAALEPLSIAMELKNINLDIQIEKKSEITADRQYCIEAISNLLKNCMEHTPKNGTITISAAENPIFTELIITDTGNGIADEDLPHIFERFYRGSEFGKNGYGIGLAFARKVIMAQNGTLQVKNAHPHGAQFEIRFYKTVV